MLAPRSEWQILIFSWCMHIAKCFHMCNFVTQKPHLIKKKKSRHSKEQDWGRKYWLEKVVRVQKNMVIKCRKCRGSCVNQTCHGSQFFNTEVRCTSIVWAWGCVAATWCPADSDTQPTFPNLLADHDVTRLTLAIIIITINSPLFGYFTVYKTENIGDRVFPFILLIHIMKS